MRVQLCVCVWFVVCVCELFACSLLRLRVLCVNALPAGVFSHVSACAASLRVRACVRAGVSACVSECVRE